MSLAEHSLSVSRSMSVTTLTYILLLFYFVVPHHGFTLLGVSASVKPADIISLMLLLTVFLTGHVSRDVLFFLFLAAWYLLCSLINNLNGAGLSFLFSAKFLQYFVVLTAIGQLSVGYRRNLLNGVLFFSFAFAFLDWTGFSLGLDWAGRISAQYGGPYELSAILLAFIFFLPRNFPFRWLITLLCFIFLLFEY